MGIWGQDLFDKVTDGDNDYSFDHIKWGQIRRGW
jgi:hypothetical protein